MLSECFCPFQLIFVSLFSSAKFKETKWLQLDTSFNLQKIFQVDTPNNVAIYFNLFEKKLSHCVLAESSSPFQNSDLKVGGQFLWVTLTT